MLNFIEDTTEYAGLNLVFLKSNGYAEIDQKNSKCNKRCLISWRVVESFDFIQNKGTFYMMKEDPVYYV